MAVRAWKDQATMRAQSVLLPALLAAPVVEGQGFFFQSAPAPDFEMDDMEPDPTFPSYPSLTDNVVIKSTATSPVVHEVDHLTGEKVCSARQSSI